MLTLSSLFTAIVSANIFLIGFLISGTLVDYKESEKIPSDLVSGIQSFADEVSLKPLVDGEKCLATHVEQMRKD